MIVDARKEETAAFNRGARAANPIFKRAYFSTKAPRSPAVTSGRGGVYRGNVCRAAHRCCDDAIKESASGISRLPQSRAFTQPYASAAFLFRGDIKRRITQGDSGAYARAIRLRNTGIKPAAIAGCDKKR